MIGAVPLLPYNPARFREGQIYFLPLFQDINYGFLYTYHRSNILHFSSVTFGKLTAVCFSFKNVYSVGSTFIGSVPVDVFGMDGKRLLIPVQGFPC
jgi:hypothetical protein